MSRKTLANIVSGQSAISNVRCIGLVSVIFGLATVVATPANSQPAGIRGKSVIISGKDTYQARRPGTIQWRFISNPWTVRTYFGTKGETFVRVSTSFSSTQGVGSRRTRSHAGGPRSAKWSGSRLTIFTSTSRRAGARRVIVQFGSGFKTCRANVIVAKARGKRIVKIRNHTEILASSWRTQRSAPCRVVSRNVFR